MSTQTVNGRVEFLDGPNKFQFYSIKVNGTKYGLGKTKPDIAPGDTVEFNAYQNDKGYWNAKGPVTKTASAPATPAVSTGQSTRASSSFQGRDGYWEAKEKHEKEVVQPRITYLAAYERAVAFVDLALRNGAIGAYAKAKDTAKLGVLEALVNEHAAKIAAQSNGNVPSAAAPDAPATAAAPEAEWS